MYKLVIIDIDGTLINNNRKITKKTKQTLKKVLDLGVNIAISTGRNNRMANKVLSKISHDLVYACGGGAHIYDLDKNYIYDGSLTSDEAREVLEAIKDRDCMYQVACKEAYYKHTPSLRAKSYDIYGHNSVKQRVINKYVGVYNIEQYHEFYHSFDSASEIIVGGDKEDLLGIKTLIESNYEHLQARDDLWENYLFIGKKNNTKSDAMRTLCKHFDVDVSEVIAIGDDCNDIDMIRDAGLGIAMGNAIKAVKDVADDVTYTNIENGVARALDHYIIKENKGKILYE